MDITLKVRPLSAYFVEKSVTLADNEELKVKIVDKGRIAGRMALLCNGKAFIADDDKIVHIDRQSLEIVNVFELKAYTEKGDVAQTWVTESLFVAPLSTDYENDRLVREREFYAELCTRQGEAIIALEDEVADLKKRCADLENGKYTILKFGGNEENEDVG